MKPTLAILGIIGSLAVGIGGAYLFVSSRDSRVAAKTIAKPSFSEICIGKVTYIQFDNAVVTKVRPDGKIWTCGGV